MSESNPSSQTPATGPLSGVRVVELAGIGPGPMCSTLLSDMGADVLRIDRNSPSGLGVSAGENRMDLLRRGRRSVAVDLKHPDGIETILRLVEKADALLEPFRPGVVERLGLGPDDCLARNPKLVYGRMTGWGQDGPLAHAAGHDLNYLAITGVLHAIGPKSHPVPPLNVVADMGGGALFMAYGLLAGIINARQTGKGQVVDAAMFEGAAYLAMANFGWMASGFWNIERENNILDGGAHFYRCYETKDGKHVSIAAIETKFYALLLEKLGIDPDTCPPQMDPDGWREMSARFQACFIQKTRDEWCEVLEGTDVCFAPVLSFAEAKDHPHAVARGSFQTVEGISQPGPAPRFSGTPAAIQSSPPEIGEQTREGLLDWGLSEAEVEALDSAGAIGWRG